MIYEVWDFLQISALLTKNITNKSKEVLPKALLTLLSPFVPFCLQQKLNIGHFWILTFP